MRDHTIARVKSCICLTATGTLIHENYDLLSLRVLANLNGGDSAKVPARSANLQELQ